MQPLPFKRSHVAGGGVALTLAAFAALTLPTSALAEIGRAHV